MAVDADIGSGGPGGPPPAERAPWGRRWIVRTVMGAGALAAVAALLWFVVLPRYRPALQDAERYGIDVSHHQRRIDWERVAGADVAFAYLKATEGATHVDRQFSRNWEQADAVGIPRGAYHFFTLCRSGREQAANFLSTVAQDPDALPPAVDLELAGNCSARPDHDALHTELGDFLREVEGATGRQAVLYVGPRFDERYRISELLDRPLWRLSFLRRPDMDEVAIWQVMGFARVPGIEGHVDLDVADLESLRTSP